MKRVMYGLMLCLLAGTGIAAAGDGQKETAAVAAAEAWLLVVDSGEYEQSWREAAAYFRNAVPESQWVQSLEAVRKPLGKCLSRAVIAADHATSLPGAPDGEYVVIQFETVFENKNSAVETVTPMLDNDGAWRVSGYFIR